MITNFTPTALVLSTGEKVAMYTARFVGTYTAVDSDGRPYDFYGSEYIVNLSTDRQTAIDKLARIAENYGLPYDTTAVYDLNEIRREREAMTTAQREAMEAYAREQEAKRAEEFAEEVKLGLFVVGKYAGLTVEQIAEIDEDYVRWIADHEETKTPFGVGVALAKAWAEANPIPTSDFVGVKGESIEITAKLNRVVCFDGMYGTQYLFRFVDTDGNIITCFSKAKAMLELDRGDVVVFKAVVKDHELSYYEDPRNNKVTIVSRPKVLKVN